MSKAIAFLLISASLASGAHAGALERPLQLDRVVPVEHGLVPFAGGPLGNAILEMPRQGLQPKL